MSDHTTTLTLKGPARTTAPAFEGFRAFLRSRLATALAVAVMWTLAVIDWLSIYAGNAPNRKIFYVIVIMAAALAAGRIAHAVAAKPR